MHAHCQIVLLMALSRRLPIVCFDLGRKKQVVRCLVRRPLIVDGLRLIVFSAASFLASHSRLILVLIFNERTVFVVWIAILERLRLNQLIVEVDLVMAVLQHVCSLEIINFARRSGRGSLDGFESLLKLSLLLLEGVQLVLERLVGGHFALLADLANSYRLGNIFDLSLLLVFGDVVFGSRSERAPLLLESLELRVLGADNDDGRFVAGQQVVRLVNEVLRCSLLAVSCVSEWRQLLYFDLGHHNWLDVHLVFFFVLGCDRSSCLLGLDLLLGLALVDPREAQS